MKKESTIENQPSNKTDDDELSTQQRILDAALHEFMLKGYAGARTSSIAEEAGVTHAMLHYYFRTKDNLFDTIIEDKISTLRDIMLTSFSDSSLPLFDTIRKAVENHYDFISMNPDLPRFMLNEVLSRPERIPLVIAQLKDQTPHVVRSLQNRINDYASQGLCRRVDAGMLMLDIVSLNIFPFTARTMVNMLLGGIMEDSMTFNRKRKAENVETILSRLRR